MKKLKVGDRIIYRGGFGTEPPTTVTVLRIEICPKGEKYGEEVQEVDFSLKDSIVCDLSNDRWCYGYYIDEIWEK